MSEFDQEGHPTKGDVRKNGSVERELLKFYDAHVEQLWRRVGCLMGGACDDVADVVQSTFLAAIRSSCQFDRSRGSAWQWLYGIARHQVALHFRKRARDSAQQLKLTPGSVRLAEWLQDDRGVSPPAELESSETRQRVRTVLRALPEEYHLLLLARYADDISAEELARQLNTTGQAVRSKLARARRAFIELFHDSTLQANDDGAMP